MINYLNRHQSVIFVYPTRERARREFFKAILPLKEAKGVLLHLRELSVTKDNPDSRVPTIVRYLSANDNVDASRGTKAIIVIPEVLNRNHSGHQAWYHLQDLHEEFRIK